MVDMTLLGLSPLERLLYAGLGLTGGGDWLKSLELTVIFGGTASGVT